MKMSRLCLTIGTALILFRCGDKTVSGVREVESGGTDSIYSNGTVLTVTGDTRVYAEAVQRWATKSFVSATMTRR